MEIQKTIKKINNKIQTCVTWISSTWNKTHSLDNFNSYGGLVLIASNIWNFHISYFIFSSRLFTYKEITYVLVNLSSDLVIGDSKLFNLLIMCQGILQVLKFLQDSILSCKNIYSVWKVNLNRRFNWNLKEDNFLETDRFLIFTLLYPLFFFFFFWEFVIRRRERIWLTFFFPPFLLNG